MNRKECEDVILHKLLEIRDIYKQYHSKGEYLSMCINKDSISFNNERWPGGKDEAMPIHYFNDMPIHKSVLDTPEGKVLSVWAKKNNFNPNEYSIIECDVWDIHKGDVVTIQPACYDDLPLTTYIVDEEPRPYVCRGEITGRVICGFVFDIPDTAIILRRNNDDC